MSQVQILLGVNNSCIGPVQTLNGAVHLDGGIGPLGLVGRALKKSYDALFSCKYFR